MKDYLLKNWQGTAAVIGVDFGDSGKGRIVDDLSKRAAIVARYNGGSNTGHTVQNQYGKFALHIIPSGIFNPKTLCLLGRGVAIDLESLIEDEFKQLKKAGVSWKKLIIDDAATLSMPWHKVRDGLREKYQRIKIGTTGRGVGPTYADRIERVGLRVRDLTNKDFAEKLIDEVNFQNKFFNLQLSFKEIRDKFSKYAKIIKPYVGKTIPILTEFKKKKKNILFEGAQGYFLDIDAGTYPFVTSSNTGTLGIWRSFDLHPSQINYVIGITKAYFTRVGAGPLPTLVKGKERDWIIGKGKEIGTTSGRIRDPGWLDLVLAREAILSNRVTSLAITKLDVLSGLKVIKICVGYMINSKSVDYLSGDADFLSKCQPVYEILPGWSQDLSGIRKFADLSKNTKNYLKFIEKFVGVPVSYIGVGPQRSQAIYV